MLFGVNFNAARAYSFGDNNAGYSLVAQDFNGDGLPDVAVAVSGYSSASVQIFLANGNGNLALANTYSLPSGLGQGVSVVSGDFNRDGKLDLAVLTINGISILLGQGDGSFAAGAFYAASGYSIVTADFKAGLPDPAGRTPALLDEFPVPQLHVPDVAPAVRLMQAEFPRRWR